MNFTPFILCFLRKKYYICDKKQIKISIMEGTLLDKISKCPNNTIVTDAWLTGQTGMIVDIQNDCVFRFVDYINNNGEPRKKHTTVASMLSCPIVACGFVGYWLHERDTKGIIALFEDYYNMRMKEYVKAHANEANAWKRDLQKEFVYDYHLVAENKLINKSKALFDYVTESDKKEIQDIIDNYLEFANNKQEELYPPKYPKNKLIEEKFLDAFREYGPAFECMEWIRTEYNMPYMESLQYKDGKTIKERLSGLEKEHHEKFVPEFVAKKFEEFDNSDLWDDDFGLMEEIEENIKSCKTNEDRIRYIISLLQPFKEFAEAFEPKAQIDEINRRIKEHKEWIQKWQSMPGNAVDERTGEPIHPKDQIAAYNNILEKFEKDIAYLNICKDFFHCIAQYGCDPRQSTVCPYRIDDEMCKYLGKWHEYMVSFAKRLASLALIYEINLRDVQENCEVYLKENFSTFDYLEYKYITSSNHARQLLDEIEAKKQKSGQNNINENNQKEITKGTEIKNKKNARKNKLKIEKQHGVEYPVFSKGSGVSEDHIKALYRLLTSRGWISTQTCLVDFMDLFAGNSNKCKIIWLGQDKIGNNEPTVLGVSALYVLFKKMADEKLITTGTNTERIGPILETHFVDTEGHFLTSVSNVNKTSVKANNYIKQILEIMRKRLDSEDIQLLLQEDMQSAYDKNDRQDLSYRRRH